MDTCVILWAAQGNRRKLSSAAIQAIENPKNEIFFSAMSVAEIARLTEKKKIALAFHWKPWLRKLVVVNGWQVLPLTWKIMEEAYSLADEFHGDPADRMIVATAKIHGLDLLTADKKILFYPHVETLW